MKKILSATVAVLLLTPMLALAAPGNSGNGGNSGGNGVGSGGQGGGQGVGNGGSGNGGIGGGNGGNGGGNGGNGGGGNGGNGGGGSSSGGGSTSGSSAGASAPSAGGASSGTYDGGASGRGASYTVTEREQVHADARACDPMGDITFRTNGVRRTFTYGGLEFHLPTFVQCMKDKGYELSSAGRNELTNFGTR